ncbi:MAG TPA: DUF4019 domain-containing protein [Longimicrobiales bacterium]|nr:DUF4019 domain-containing protein [Longimicrobiales bacterium]
MRRRLPIVLLVPLLLAAAPASSEAQSARPVLPAAADSTAQGAEQAARAWLALLDSGRYDSAWVHVVPVMRAAIGYEAWRSTLLEARGPFEPLSGRRLVRAEGAGSMFPGRSYLLSFELATTLDPATSETVVLVREQGVWKVGGYGVRR